MTLQLVRVKLIIDGSVVYIMTFAKRIKWTGQGKNPNWQELDQ